MDTYRNTDPSPTPDDRSTRAQRAYAWFEVNHAKVAVGFGVLVLAGICALSPFLFFLSLISGFFVAAACAAVHYLDEGAPLALLCSMGAVVLCTVAICGASATAPASASDRCECAE